MNEGMRVCVVGSENMECDCVCAGGDDVSINA